MIESNPLEMPIEVANKYWLMQHQISQFEADYKLFIKLRNMEEFKVNPKLNLFVKNLEHSLYRETFSDNNYGESG